MTHTARPWSWLDHTDDYVDLRGLCVRMTSRPEMLPSPVLSQPSRPMARNPCRVATARDKKFDVVLLTALWIHLDEEQRQLAMPTVAGLVRPGGAVCFTLRHGRPLPGRRRLFERTAEETVTRAGDAGLHLAVRIHKQAEFHGQPDVG